MIPDWLEKVEKQANTAGKPAVVSAAVRGLADARFDPDLAKAAAALRDGTLVRWPGDTEVLVARAVLLVQWAEWGSPRWEAARTREAVFAVERLRAIVPDDPDAAALLALRAAPGGERPGEGRTGRGPAAGRPRRRRAAHRGPTGRPRGRAAGERQDRAGGGGAEQARKLGPPTAGVLIHLAQAYHTRGQTDRGAGIVGGSPPPPPHPARRRRPAIPPRPVARRSVTRAALLSLLLALPVVAADPPKADPPKADPPKPAPRPRWSSARAVQSEQGAGSAGAAGQGREDEPEPVPAEGAGGPVVRPGGQRQGPPAAPSNRPSPKTPSTRRGTS